MMNEMIQTTMQPQFRLTHLSNEQRELLPLAFGGFLDTVVTATSRATYYNTRAEQEAAIQTAHNDLFALDRGVYTASLMLPGLTDYSRQLGVVRLLQVPQAPDGWMTAAQEQSVVRSLTRTIPPQRMLKMFGMLRTENVNNSRTRRLMLSTILSASRLEFWAVKYRRKLQTALVHAWGRRMASILRVVLAKSVEDRTVKECQIVQRNLGRFAPGDSDRTEQCVRFILGDEECLTLRRLKAYRDAKRDLDCGQLLPFETLEGLRSRFHRKRSSAEVLELTRTQLTAGQKIGLQKKAREAEVEVRFDPAHYDAVRLYLYAFEMGMTEEIRSELLVKATKVASRLPVQFDHAAILLDVSASMRGHESQAMRPIAVALALRDVLAATADRASVLSSDGKVTESAELIGPAGDTSLASGLITLLKQGPDVVFVLTDGYENAPAGRFTEVIRSVRNLGIETPVHQFSPVYSAESGGVRSLSDQVPGMPASKPESIGLGLLKAVFEADVDRGVSALMNMICETIDEKQDAECIEEVKNDIF